MSFEAMTIEPGNSGDLFWDIHVAERHLEIVTWGVADGKASLQMAEAIAQAMRNRRITRALIDHRGLDAVVGSTLDIYNRPKIFRLIGVILRIRIAEIIKPEHVEHFQFFETVCRNRGYQVAIFHEKDEALAWLLE